MTARLPFALYDAFTDVPFGGSQACIVNGARPLSRAVRVSLARELGMPATAFVEAVSGTSVTAQFFSTVMEQPMCGHGTVCLFTHLVDRGELVLDRDGKLRMELCLPKRSATVELRKIDDERVEVMLDVKVASFSDEDVDLRRLARILGLAEADLHPDLPVETARADFVHLVVPLRSLDAARRIVPDFPAIIDFCKATGAETIAVFSTEVERPESTIHVRDFCPAVGVPESSSAGTTNAALACFLLRHRIVEPDATGIVRAVAEQGLELGRPSRIHSILTLVDGAIARLQVGGISTKIVDGYLALPADVEGLTQ